MPVFGSGPRRTDGQTNNPIRNTPTFLLPNQISNLALGLMLLIHQQLQQIYQV